MGPLGDRVVHTDLPAVHLSSVQRILGLRGIVLGRFNVLILHRKRIIIRVYQILEVDEGKASAAARVTVENHLDLLEWAELLELGLKLPLIGVEAQSEHPKALAGRSVISVALVASSVGHGGPGVVPVPASSGVLPLAIARSRP